MAAITFRVSEEEKEFLEKISEFENVLLSDFVRQQAIKAEEELVDNQTYQELMKEHYKKDESISHEQMIKELDL